MARVPINTTPWGEALNADLDGIESKADAAQASANSAGTAAAAATALAETKANDSSVVKLTGNQNVAGVKTFSSSPVVPDPTTSDQAATKNYVDLATTGVATDATVVKLSGDQTVNGVKTFNASPIVPAPTTANQAARKADVDLKANDADVVKLTGAQTVAGVKTFSSPPVLPAPVGANDAARKSDVDLKANDADVVKLTGNQTIAGTKTFSSAVIVPNASIGVAKINGLNATAVIFDEAASSLDSVNVQAAIEELNTEKISATDHAILQGRVTTLENNQPPATKRVRLTADVTLAATSTTMQNVTGLVFADLPANSEWDFQIELSVASSDASDIKLQFTGPAGGNIMFITTGPNAGNTADGGTQKSVVRSGFNQSSGGFGTLAVAAQPLVITGTIIVGGTAGSVQLQAAQNTSDATAPVIQANSKATAVRAA